MPVSPTSTNTPFGKWDPGGCNCKTAFVAVQGCGEAYSGLTVSVYTSAGGTLLYSGTTDGTGTVHTTVPAGSYYVAITGQSTRFAAYGQTATLSTVATNVLNLTAAAGYVCLGLGCLQPTTTTLNYTGPQGAHSLPYIGGSQWKSADGVVLLETTGTSATILYNGGISQTTLSAHTCPPAPTLNFFDGSTVTE